MCKRILIFFAVLGACCMACLATSPAEVLKKAATAANSSKGIKGSFSLTMSGKSLTGKISVSKEKFTISTPVSSTWYNGTSMWTYNPSSKETTLVKPTAAELQEANPLTYLKTYATDFTPSFSNKKISGKYVVNLVPKSKRSGIKNIEVVIDSKTFKPNTFTITSRDGSKVILKMQTLQYGVSIPVSTFEYPKNKYPKIEIIDLR